MQVAILLYKHLIMLLLVSTWLIFVAELQGNIHLSKIIFPH